jgi:hypothetical protein
MLIRTAFGSRKTTSFRNYEIAARSTPPYPRRLGTRGKKLRGIDAPAVQNELFHRLLPTFASLSAVTVLT